MYRFLVILVVVHTALAITEPTLEDIINQIFGVETDVDDIDNSVEKPKDCVSVEGRGTGCYECHFCNNTYNKNLNYQTNAIEVILKDDKCTTQVKVCCVDTNTYLNLRKGERCGTPNPDGIPRRRRQFPRSMLQAEFPWRAWVHSKSTSSPLCAATYIHEDKMALITLASCVRAYTADKLEVAFIRNGPRAAVDRVVMHDSYTPGHDESNDIAILQLVSLEPTPLWTVPACLPPAAPPLVTPCVTTTSTDLRIESVIPVRSSCTLDNSSLPEPLICALAPPGDYQPEAAAGLYCTLDSPPKYTINGLFTSENQNIASYIDVWRYMPWLKEKLDLRDQ